MKLAFSTLACPNWNFSEITSAAKDFGFDGIEVRGLGEDIFAVSAPPFSERELPETIRKLGAQRLSIPCFSSACCLKSVENRRENIGEITEYIRLAGKLSTPYVRVLADRAPAPEGDVDDEAVVSQLVELAPVAEENGVTLLVETNGAYADTERLLLLLQRVASDAVAALWDMHHPYRIAGESPEKTVQTLGSYIKHVHIKDSAVFSAAGFDLTLVGEGKVPVAECVDILRRGGYDGYFSFEWEKLWHPEIPEPEIAIPHYMTYLRKNGFIK